MGVPLHRKESTTVAQHFRLPGPESFGVTHTGLVRAQNEDCWLADEAIGLLLVADGVGGQADGALASRTAVDSIDSYLRRAAPVLFRASSGADQMAQRGLQERAVKCAVAFANQRLFAVNAGAKRVRDRRGSTIAGLWAPATVDSLATIFHVGDSRVYLLRDGLLKPLTRDHSAYQQWLDSGRCGSPPPKSFILQALGLSDVAPGVMSVQACDGDHFLLCSDGVTNVIEDREMEEALAGSWSLQGACERLISLGLARGGPDNLTAVLCKFAEKGST